MTKQIKRMLSILITVALTAAMMIGTSVLTFAANANITVPSGDAHTYAVYQIFTGDLADGVLSNVKWGQNGTGTQGEDVSKDILATLEGIDSKAADTTKLTEIEKYVNLTSTAYGTVSNAAALSVPTGYYLLKDNADLSGKQDSYTKYVVAVVGPTTINRKADVPESYKKVKDINDSTETSESAWQDSADHDIGDEINYQLTAKLPDNVSAYSTYTLNFVDDLSAGLEYVAGTAEIFVNETSKGKLEPTGAKEGESSSYTGGNILRWNIADIKAAAYGASDNDTITIEYKAKLTSDAVVGSAGNPNKMHIEFSNNPNSGGSGETGKTPDDTVIVFTYKTIINKVGPDGKALAGATFTLEKQQADNTWKTITVATNDDGTVFTFTGLDDGNYRLTETKEPSGYNKLTEPIYFTITAAHDVTSDNPALTSLTGKEKTNAEFTSDKESGLTFTPALTDGSLSANVKNEKGSTLPSTGGMGTTLFYVIGVILVLGAGILLVAKRRVNEA